MSTWNEPAICPICGARTIWTVNSSGDYDPPIKPHEENPNDCQTCKILKQTNPGMYDLLAKLWSKLLDERAANEKFNDKRERELFSDFDLYLPFRDNPGCWADWTKTLRKSISFHTKISANSGTKNPEKDSWVWEKSVEELVHQLIAAIKKEKVRR